MSMEGWIDNREGWETMRGWGGGGRGRRDTGDGGVSWPVVD